ncbi:predicted protein [Nematostella vectensis]|uniref:DUF1279 domain-containing protein n=1 Tax=Nematostella vectensis TaxID=45351 RepID=A7SLH1_NEMVE|nr:predicted protein [Nematostella vectensis]|eukprot:XP_001627552.1 predicted protein [Nematostella vectensis]
MALSRSFIRLSSFNIHFIQRHIGAFSVASQSFSGMRPLNRVNSMSTKPNTNGNNTGNSNENDGKIQTMSQAQRLRKIFAEYGSIAVVFHVSISLTSLGICYTAVSSGLDVPGLLQSVGLSKGLSDSALTTGASTFVIAYACHKVFVPVRMFLTITCTPLIVHRLRAMGFLKAPVTRQ